MPKNHICRHIIKRAYRNSPFFPFAAATGHAIALHGRQPKVVATLKALWAIYVREQFDRRNQAGSFLEFIRRCEGRAPKC